MTYEPMADAAFAANIPPGFTVAAGYYGGGVLNGVYQPAHVWPTPDWERFPGFKLPIWVGGGAGDTEGQEAVRALVDLGVPAGSITALDMETRKDITYVQAFGAMLGASGYKVWVYGSASTVFGNPGLNGYWVADYTPNTATIIRLLEQPHVRAVQYAAGPGFDRSLVKAWTEGEMWHG